MLCILCPGQGSQDAGMFERLRADPVARGVLEQALREKWLAEEVAQWLTASAPHEEMLHVDRFAQPLLCLYQQAVWASVAPHLARPSAFGGLSVGELSVLGCAGALEASAVVRLAARRAELLDAAAPPGGLVAVRGLDRHAIAALCKATEAAVAIQFGSDRWTLGCLAPQREIVISAARERGATLVAPLAVAVASHTPRMQAAAEPFRASLDAAEPARPRAPVLAGTTGQRLWSPSQIIAAQCDQLHRTIRWDLCIDAAVSSGIRTFLELGPGATLSHMLLSRDPTLAARSADEFSTFADAAAWAQRQ